MHQIATVKASAAGFRPIGAGKWPRAPRQRALFCPCGRNLPAIAGLCPTCYGRRRHSLRSFGGLREAVLDRDRSACRICGSGRWIAVHHRRPGHHHPQLRISLCAGCLCAGCHARVHRTGAIRKWTPPALVSLWEEQHPGVPVQLQLGLEERCHG